MLKAGKISVVCSLMIASLFASHMTGEGLAGEKHRSLPEDFGIAQNDSATVSSSACVGSQEATSKTAVEVNRSHLMSAKEKLGHYIGATYGPTAIGFSIIGAGLSQAIDSVPEWGQGMEGYAKRFGSRYANKIVQNSIEALVGIILDEDPRYVSSNRQGLWRRSWNATRQLFLTNKDSGGKRSAYSKIIAIGGALYISRRWHPESERRLNNYLSAGAVCLGMEAAKNLFAEFWPDLRHRLLR